MGPAAVTTFTGLELWRLQGATDKQYRAFIKANPLAGYVEIAGAAGDAVSATYAKLVAKRTVQRALHFLRAIGRRRRSWLASRIQSVARGRPNSVKIKSRHFTGFCGLKHVSCMSNLLGIFVLGHYGALYTQNDENDVIFF
jgi:hypothetical protein